MDIEKLTIGNYVLYNNIPMKIYAISMPMPNENEHFNNKAKVTLWNNGLIDATSDDIEPIRITEEMLEVNGFQKTGVDLTGNRNYLKGKILVSWLDTIPIAVVSGIIAGGNLDNLDIGCFYWHTLQNVYKILTGNSLGFNELRL